MKKILALAIAFMLCASMLCACGDDVYDRPGTGTTLGGGTEPSVGSEPGTYSANNDGDVSLTTDGTNRVEGGINDVGEGIENGVDDIGRGLEDIGDDIENGIDDMTGDRMDRTDRTDMTDKSDRNNADRNNTAVTGGTNGTNGDNVNTTPSGSMPNGSMNDMPGAAGAQGGAMGENATLGDAGANGTAGANSANGATGMNGANGAAPSGSQSADAGLTNGSTNGNSR